jgi:hypothetical protein
MRKVIAAAYERAGDIQTGSFVLHIRPQAEFNRRKDLR